MTGTERLLWAAFCLGLGAILLTVGSHRIGSSWTVVVLLLTGYLLLFPDILRRRDVAYTMDDESLKVESARHRVVVCWNRIIRVRLVQADLIEFVSQGIDGTLSNTQIRLNGFRKREDEIRFRHRIERCLQRRFVVPNGSLLPAPVLMLSVLLVCWCAGLLGGVGAFCLWRPTFQQLGPQTKTFIASLLLVLLLGYQTFPFVLIARRNRHRERSTPKENWALLEHRI